MPIRSNAYRPLVPALQADAVLSQANPVSGTKYTVLATTLNVLIRGASISATWTVQPTPLEMWFTIDGIALGCVGQVNPVSLSTYYAILRSYTESVIVQGTDNLPSSPYIIEGRIVTVEAETTSGTTSALDARVKYSRW